MQGEHEALVAAAQAGDMQAFDSLVMSYRDDLWGFLLGRAGQVSDAEDLFQDVWVQVQRKLHQLREVGRFRSWLFAIAINAVRAQSRRLGRQRAMFNPLEDTQTASGNPGPDRRVAGSQRWSALRDGLQKLSPRQREMLLLEAVSDMPQKDIAELVGANLNTVKTNIRRARIKLARHLAEVGLD